MKTITDFKPEDVYFTSDTHFNHANILKFCNRPFLDVNDMNEKLVDNWNKVVSDTSTVFHLGDFAFGGFPVWEEIRSRLKGHIYLIKGNHDFKQNLQNSERLENMFDIVTQQMIITINKQLIILNHYPLLCYSGSYDNRVWALHGHCHSGPNSSGMDDSRLKIRFPTQYDVGVDNNNFTPISFFELEDIIKRQIRTFK